MGNLLRLHRDLCKKVWDALDGRDISQADAKEIVGATKDPARQRALLSDVLGARKKRAAR